MILAERWIAFGHLNGRDTKGPDISPRVVTGLTNHFWRHPEGGTDKSVALGFVRRKLGGDSKVGYQKTMNKSYQMMEEEIVSVPSLTSPDAESRTLAALISL